jgi:hypothetical protein
MSASNNKSNKIAKPSFASRPRDLFGLLNARAQRLAFNDDTGMVESISASASAMIADSLNRLSEVEPAHDPSAAPSATPEALHTTPRLRLVRED